MDPQSRKICLYCPPSVAKLIPLNQKYCDKCTRVQITADSSFKNVTMLRVQDVQLKLLRSDGERQAEKTKLLKSDAKQQAEQTKLLQSIVGEQAEQTKLLKDMLERQDALIKTLLDQSKERK